VASSAASTGFLGDRLQQALATEGVRPALPARVDAPTTLGLVGLDAQGVPDYAFYGHGCADRLLLPADLDAIPKPPRRYHFGSYAMVVQPVGATQRALVEQREWKRSVVAYDPNVRSTVEPDLARVARHPAWMLPRTPPAEAQRRGPGAPVPGRQPRRPRPQLAHGGRVELVVMTRGAEGAGPGRPAGARRVTGGRGAGRHRRRRRHLPGRAAHRAGRELPPLPSAR
jgi:fructokinase